MDEAQRAEYQTLRSEILQHDRVISQIYALMVAAEGAIVGWGLSSNNGLVFLIGFLVVPPVFYYIWDKRFTIWKIAGYIRAFLEDEISNLGWESRRAVLREIGTKTHTATHAVPFGVVGVEFASFHIFLLGNLFACGYFLLQQVPGPPWPNWLLFAAGWLVWVLFAIHSWVVKKNVLARESGGATGQYNLWLQVKEREEPRKT